MNRLNRNLIYFFPIIIVIIPSIFNSENYLFIRLYSLIIIFFSVILFRKIEKFNILSLLILIIYIASIVLHYFISPNAYNIRSHFGEYFALFVLLFVLSSLKSDNNKMIVSIVFAVILSGIIQIFYAIPQLIKGVSRIEGNTNYPNYLAFLLVLAFLSSMFLLVDCLSKKNDLKKIIIYICLCLVFIITGFKTGSRSVLIMFPLTIFCFMILYKKKWSIPVMVIILLLVIIIPSKAKNRFLNEGEINPYGVQRKNIQRQVFNIAKENMPFGVGYNNLEFHTRMNNFPVEGRIGRYAAFAKIAHNEYLEWVVNAGIFGIMIFLLLIFGIIVFLRKNKVNSIDRIYLITALFAFTIYSFIDNSLYLPYNSIIFFIIVSMIMKSYFTKKTRLLNYSMYIIICIGLVVLLLDSAVGFTTKKLYDQVSKINKNTSLEELRNISDNLLVVYDLSNAETFMSYKFFVDKKVFKETGNFDDFMEIVYDLNRSISLNKYNHNIYINAAQLFQEEKHGILRKMENVDSMIIRNYRIAVKYNPYNPFLRYSFAEYLLQIQDTVYAIENLKKAIQNEPFFIDGYKLLFILTGNTYYEKKYLDILKNIEMLKEKAILPYEKKLLSIREID